MNRISDITQIMFVRNVLKSYSTKIKHRNLTSLSKIFGYNLYDNQINYLSHNLKYFKSLTIDYHNPDKWPWPDNLRIEISFENKNGTVASKVFKSKDFNELTNQIKLFIDNEIKI